MPPSKRWLAYSLASLLLISACGGESGEEALIDAQEEFSLDISDLGPPRLDAQRSVDEGQEKDVEILNCEPPSYTWLSVNRIPESMNGSRPFTNHLGHRESFSLLLPPQGFSLDIVGDPEDVHRYTLMEIGCAGWDAWTETEQTEDGWRWRVQEPLPLGISECQAQLLAPCEFEPRRLSLELEIAELLPELDPFAVEEKWLLLYHRDQWSLEINFSDGGLLRVDGSPEPNGLPDFKEALLGIGLASEDQAPGAEALEEDGALGVSEIFQRRLMRATLERIRLLFQQSPEGTHDLDSVPINFFLEGDEGAPDPRSFIEDGSFSMIGIGGGDPQGRNIGRASIDWNNQNQEDNASPLNRGIFTTTLIALFMDHPTAANILAPFAPSLGGEPLGSLPVDVLIFSGAPTEDAVMAQRAQLLELGIDLLSRGLAALISHEISHSLGLVPYGPPPQGLFAGETRGEFVAGAFDGAHINTEGYNIMQQGYSLGDNPVELLSAEPRFNPLNLAYLQGRIIVDPERLRADPEAALKGSRSHR